MAGPGRRRLGTGSGRGLREDKGLPKPGAPECVPAAWRRQRMKGGKRKHLRPIRHLLRGKACRLRRGEGCAERRPRSPFVAPSLGLQPSPSHLVTRPATPRPPTHLDTLPGHRGRRAAAPQGRGEEREDPGAEGGDSGGREGAGGEAGWRREDGLTERLWFGNGRLWFFRGVGR